ncbi:MAG: hypothetical protein ACUZ77_08315 [Candidatus Brocadiales bacterium]
MSGINGGENTLTYNPTSMRCTSKGYGMFSDFKKYSWALEIYRYDSHEHLLASLEREVILPAKAKVKELK